ncbi:complex I subunit 1 family protein [Histidinibacterium aquaticum]|uniref:NADH-quinone oxidoreductase subunit H n=1 Tax=Histidinibacterium aquaticum TaxID=2613962 RepID=A0A5J5GC22_9RHOB|nr:complex I subunit 1 family protein [Histidinibacterium aquaticum]KAA9005571.1 NADH-quinone oxidoreductase subunit H [Histidinibacterium aquaticum]
MTLLLALAVLGTLLAGTLFAAVLDRTALPLVAAFGRQRVETEAPDRMNRDLAPAWYLALAAVGLSVVPFAPGLALIDSPVGIVIWGACEALTVVTVFLHGWSPNAPFPLIGAYRYAAIGLPVMLPSMFVLIAAALPAESLSLVAIVESQREIWNVVRQPLGLPLFLVVALALTLRGPMDYADAADIASGTSAEDSGPARAAWQVARLAMLVSVSAIAATVFLGGPLGPVLPGPVWLWLKTAVLMALIVWLGDRVARTTPSRMLGILWVVLLPLSFLDLVISGVLAL